MTSMSDCHFLCQRREIIDFKKERSFFVAFCTFFHSWKNLWNFSISWFIIPNWSKVSKILLTDIHICRGHFLTKKSLNHAELFEFSYFFFSFSGSFWKWSFHLVTFFAGPSSTNWTLGEISVANSSLRIFAMYRNM